MSLLLAGDIGGTNTRLHLEQKEDSQVIYEQEFNNSGKDLVSIIKGFLEEASEKSQKEAVEKSQEIHPEIACFAVAGLVDKKNNTCDLTNIGWHLDGQDLRERLGIERVDLINDFEAVGYGILQLRESQLSLDFKTLQEGRPSERGDAPIGVIGAGTGLGEAFILRNKPENTWTVYPTEGGHVDFSARSIDEFELQEFIKKNYQLLRVSVERVVSEPGIVAIYQFLRERKEDSESEAIAAAVESWEKSDKKLSDTPADKISDAAFKGNKFCQKVMQMFTEAYGSEVGNLALKLLPYQGLYIAGGIAPKIFVDPKLEELFLKELRNKGRMREKVIEEIPIYLVTNLQVGLIGAAYYARHKVVLLSQEHPPLEQEHLTLAEVLEEAGFTKRRRHPI